ncbi:hypothetical protein DFJ74DRAFT_83642 [Hyaloraphidium curvatum]|nr:hypothetical protein DFJ74DRAFT_83642 [Hyaloraphidium curvatum]
MNSRRRNGPGRTMGTMRTISRETMARRETRTTSPTICSRARNGTEGSAWVGFPTASRGLSPEFPRPCLPDGYQSDDSDDGKAAKRGAGAEVDDMFGEGDAEDKKKDKKEVKFMRRGDIEGQEWDAAAAEYEDDGTKIEPFNMDEELEEGAFDEAGMYIRKKDEFAHHDNWLQGTTKEDIEKVKPKTSSTPRAIDRTIVD